MYCIPVLPYLYTCTTCKQVELRLQTAETRFEEEKLVIQKTQEESIKKVCTCVFMCIY